MDYRIVVLSYENDDGYAVENLYINGEHRNCVYPMWECPEDACIERNLVGCSDIASYMKEAFVACQNGEYNDITYAYKVIDEDLDIMSSEDYAEIEKFIKGD